MSNTYKSGSHSKYLLQYHLIFVCKYRRKLLSSSNIASDIKRLSIEYCQKHNVVIHYMETDKDHIHYMIETTPNINLSNMVKTMKSYITYVVTDAIYNEDIFNTNKYYTMSTNIHYVLLPEQVERIEDCTYETTVN